MKAHPDAFLRLGFHRPGNATFWGVLLASQKLVREVLNQVFARRPWKNDGFMKRNVIVDPMPVTDPILDYASNPEIRPRKPRRPAIISQLAVGFAFGGLVGLLCSHLLCRYLGPISFRCFTVPTLMGCLAGSAVNAMRIVPGHHSQWRVMAVLSLVGLIIFELWTIGWSNTRLRAEMSHGMRLPPSAHNIQCRGDALTSIADRAEITWFQISAGDLKPFLASLGTTTTTQPIFGASLANPEYTGQQKTWTGTESFNQWLQFRSPVGDFLIVEVWDLPGGEHLIKMYTDWN
jgi:hypothetical protein